ncbi:hypothetical protein, partial [Stenotrophomonas maltophilia]|uniref:hypothetical protein n=1 Tax=Stenotrophomonas maltophilia TaxID=40324 RepID=UPI001953419B
PHHRSASESRLMAIAGTMPLTTPFYICRLPVARRGLALWHAVPTELFPEGLALCGAAPGILWSSELGEQSS